MPHIKWNPSNNQFNECHEFHRRGFDSGDESSELKHGSIFSKTHCLDFSRVAFALRFVRQIKKIKKK